jgi:hypothetical protein
MTDQNGQRVQRHLLGADRKLRLAARTSLLYGPASCCCGPGARATSIHSTCSMCPARSGSGSSRSCRISVPATGPPAPGAPTGPRTTSSATCATAPRSPRPPARMTAPPTSPSASTRESRLAGGWPHRLASHPAPPSAASERRPKNCSFWPMIGWPRAAYLMSACRMERWTGRSWCCMPSGIRGSTSATCCSRGALTTPLAPT